MTRSSKFPHRREEIQRLRQAIHDLHGCDSIHKTSVEMNEIFQDEPVWKGTVEVFQTIGHPEARWAYAWSYVGDAGETQYLVVLGVPPINSALDAVKAAVMAHTEKPKKSQ